MMTGLVLTCLSAALGAADTPAPSMVAKEILGATGVQGGLIVHLGCGSGALTAALRVDERFSVRGLATDAAQVAAARDTIRALGLYGPVSVDRLTGSSLPYVDNLINLVVAEDAGPITVDEMLRVLVPNGVAYVKQGDRWSKIVKPRPANIDEWSHFLHDASNNAVAHDTVVGPPRRLQWVAPPLWLRSHETPSGIEAPVSAGGRLFYIFDEGLIGITDERLPDRWSVVCRDAFNGKLLWKRPLGPWGWRQWDREKYEGKDWTVLSGARTNVPNENQRRLVADGDRLYATLGFHDPLSILDAATGALLMTVEGTKDAREILLSDGVLVVYTQDPNSEVDRRRGVPTEGRAALVAVRAETGEMLWRKPIDPIRPLFLAIDDQGVVYQTNSHLVCLDLNRGEPRWRVRPEDPRGITLVATAGVVLIQGNRWLESHDAEDGRLLWRKKVAAIGGNEREDLFVVDGLVWRGMASTDADGKLVGKSANALAVGLDPRTGEERRRIAVDNLRSPEHHHRCYRNKATSRYVISAMEGAEFLDLQSDGHSQNNWLRGACKYGVMPCNGLLYVPPDQCFCHPGSKLLGYTAVASDGGRSGNVIPDEERLERGIAYRDVPAAAANLDADSWPTYRHDGSRSGATPSAVAPRLSPAWRVRLGGRLTPAVVAEGTLLVAASDAHTIHALDAQRGDSLWTFTAGGRVDSPPTIYRDRVLFGARDGRVYCLRASDGQLVWRFLAAPENRMIAAFDQLESVWPVHGSVLVHDDVAYVAAGRSTYLDGGIHLYGLDPLRGTMLHHTTIDGPHPDQTGVRDVSFYTLGANSDVLVSEGGFIYMRQKKFTPTLEEVKTPVLSNKGGMDVGLHLFSTSGLLDGSWYNRTFWMYAQRWPGFQLANQAPKSGQLLVVDDQRTYGVKVFHRRNRHSTMFFPGQEGYLLFADKNTTEPQIVGEEGSREPVAWLPQSEYARPNGPRRLDSVAFELDKMVGYTRAEPPVWKHWLPLRVRALVKADTLLFAAGAPDVLEPEDPYAAFEGRRGARLAVVSGEDGTLITQTDLDSPPVFDGMIAAGGRLFLSLRDGSVVCLAGEHPSP